MKKFCFIRTRNGISALSAKTALLLREYGVKVFVSNCDYSFEDKEIILCPFNDAIKDST